MDTLWQLYISYFFIVNLEIVVSKKPRHTKVTFCSIKVTGAPTLFLIYVLIHVFSILLYCNFLFTSLDFGLPKDLDMFIDLYLPSLAQ